MAKDDFYDSLLDDPVDTEEVVDGSTEEQEIPLIPEVESTEETTTEETATETNTEEETVSVEDDLLTSYLKSRGIADPTKIQFENDEGGIDELDFASLPKEEQLSILNEIANSNYSDYEKEVIEFIRQNGGDLRQIVANYQQKAIDDYLAQNPDSKPQKTYSIDDYSDDELYIADLAVKFPDFTEDELNSKLESAKINEELYKKEVDALRQFYKNEEDRQAEQTRLTEQQQQEALYNALIDASNNFKEIVLDAEDPQSDTLVLEDEDRQRAMSYLLELDTDSQSQFDKDLSDPSALIELAW